MKNITYIFYLSLFSLCIQAQNNDSTLINTINEYRIRQKLQPFSEDTSLSNSIKYMLKVKFDSPQELSNNDSFRRILRSNDIYDYNFKLIKLTDKKRRTLNFTNEINTSDSLKSLLNNQKYNKLSTFIEDKGMKCNIYILATENHIQLDNAINVEGYLSMSGNYNDSEFILSGKSDLKQIYYKAFKSEDINDTIIDSDNIIVDKSGAFSKHIPIKPGIDYILFIDKDNKPVSLRQLNYWGRIK